MSTHHSDSRRLLRCRVAFTLLLLASVSATGAGEQRDPGAGADGLFFDAEPAVSRSVLPGADTIAVPGITTLRSRQVDIDFDRLAEARAVAGRANAPVGAATLATLTLNLFDDVVLPAFVERAAATASGSGYIVSGRLDDVEAGNWKLLVYDGVVTGTVRTPTMTYRIRTVDGVHVISQIDTSVLPPFEDRVIPTPPGARPTPALSGPDPVPGAVGRTTDPFAEAVIDLAVAYTPAAEAGAMELHGDVGIEGLIDEMIDNAHEAYERSGALLRLRSAWRGPLACSGTACSDSSDALAYLATRDDLRTLYGADLLSWIVDIPGNARGIAHHGGYYSTVSYDTETMYSHTFAHELGHNMYLNHDRWAVVNEPDGGGTLNDPFPYSHGYVSRGCGWRTVMAYSHVCGHEIPVLTHFSNPNKLHQGERVGVFGDSPSPDVDGPADAVRSLNEKRHVVASNWEPPSDRDALHTFFVTIDAYGTFVGPTVFPWSGVQFNAEDRVTHVYLNGSRLSGEIPDYLGTLTELRYLGLATNFLTGTIPASLGNMTHLERLALGYNDFTRGIPAALGDLTNLKSLDLQGNQLSGFIPPELGNLTSLEQLTFGGKDGNQLSGPIPRELGNLTSLNYLDIRNNRLSGPIPPELGNLTSLEWLDLGNNELTGPIPAELGNLTNLQWLFIDRDTGLCLAPDFHLDSQFGRLAQSAGVSVCSAGVFTFTDDPLVAGVTAVKAVHFTELRERIGDLRVAHGLDRFTWTDPTLVAGVTAVKAVHLSELRTALRQAYAAAGETPGFSAQPMQAGEVIRGAHVNELRRAVKVLGP